MPLQKVVFDFAPPTGGDNNEYAGQNFQQLKSQRERRNTQSYFDAYFLDSNKTRTGWS